MQTIGGVAMKVSTKGRYALRMLVDLYEHRDQGFISLKDISIRQDVSKKYLENIVALFADTDMLDTARGARGGYLLKRAARDISVGEVLKLTEGSLASVTCLEDLTKECDRAEACKTLPVWKGLTDCVDQYLAQVTIEDIAEEKVPGCTCTVNY